ncbi:hypothetical protein DICPUDRAFT_75290 [Dictyostelium purpureum]|uniref:Dickkopf N-terminal cysteine-rich domain-containing protein n=1 Tax=Dictyostelium purpureum TaxID=5786 RepID=F0ZA86_DICPU|nr:uncharacterized protein DICPUDRAFT_75290 [Dictyostelium purpureum]EGC39188.1 hypothetical protein DICPUDRAFT_75290 [Dictyostelium purpureum]|eukprot:XP_003284334.1 hypothetical protein DICPUDRAFT_75290 [Dictyostelium purpureum]
MINFKIILIYIIIINILFVQQSIQQQCDQCSDEGSPCGYLDRYDIYKITRCNDRLICVKTGVAHSNNICIYPSTIHGSCRYDSDCGTGLACLKINSTSERGICENIKFSRNGEPCRNDEHCAGRLSVCRKDICVTTSYRGECFDDMDCDIDDFCLDDGVNERTCQRKLKVDQGNCTVHGCENNSFCFSETNKCTKYFSLELNQTCEITKHCNIDNNLICDLNTRKCIPYVDPGISQFYDCMSNNSWCPYPTVCHCSGTCYNRFKTDREHKSSFNEMFECFDNYNCSLVLPNVRSPDSCVSRFCKKEYCHYSMVEKRGNFAISCNKRVDDYCNDLDNIPSVLVGDFNSTSTGGFTLPPTIPPSNNKSNNSNQLSHNNGSNYENNFVIKLIPNLLNNSFLTLLLFVLLI